MIERYRIEFHIESEAYVVPAGVRVVPVPDPKGNWVRYDDHLKEIKKEKENGSG